MLPVRRPPESASNVLFHSHIELRLTLAWAAHPRHPQAPRWTVPPMPLLEAEPRLFPDDLLLDPTAARASDARWWVLYTRARREKDVARKLRGKQVPHYLPQREFTRQTGGRVRSSYLPLFPGYVFLFGDESDRSAALETNLLCAAIPVPDQTRLLADLKRIEWVLGGPAEVTPEETVPSGTSVEVTDGAFRGLRGTVVRRGGQSRLVVEVEFLRCGVSVEVEEWALRILSVDSEGNTEE